MDAKQKNNLKGAALAALIAGGTGAVRIIDGVRRWLQKLSTALSVNIADVKTMAAAAHEEAVGDGVPSPTDVKQK